jgi:hypothetical protein
MTAKTKTKAKLPVLKATAGASTISNLDTASFRCVFPSCGGVCCRGSRPPVEPAEEARIAKVLPKVLPHMRPEAQAAVGKRGFVTNRVKSGRKMISISNEYCVFYNDGCVLHRLGGAEGDTTKYKPWVCTAFPLDQGNDGQWEVRQWGRKGEVWDLFCLNPKEAPDGRPAQTLALEIGFIADLEGPKQRWRFK